MKNKRLGTSYTPLSLVIAVPVLSLLSVLEGCTGGTTTHGFHPLMKDQAYWFNYDATRRGTILAPRQEQQKGVSMCAEPSPDAALNTAITKLAELSASGKALDAVPEAAASVKAQVDYTGSVVELVSRTQTILFLREAMYRLCEQQLNGTLDPRDVRSLYATIVNTSVTLAEAQVIETLSRVKDKDMAGDLLQIFINGQIELKKIELQQKKDTDYRDGTPVITQQN